MKNNIFVTDFTMIVFKLLSVLLASVAYYVCATDV